MEIQQTTQTESAKKMQVNAQLDDELAEAFDQYFRHSGVGTISAAVRSLIVPELRRLGYLRPVNADGAIGSQIAN